MTKCFRGPQAGPSEPVSFLGEKERCKVVEEAIFRGLGAENRGFSPVKAVLGRWSLGEQGCLGELLRRRKRAAWGSGGLLSGQKDRPSRGA